MSDPRLAEPLWRPYLEDVEVACLRRIPAEDPALVLAIWARETWFGTCAGYEPKGPNGRGDGGHGRGLGQIDDRGPWKHLIPTDGEDWPVVVQADATCTVLAGARVELAEFRGALSDHAWDEAVACRYNCALWAVQFALRNGRDPNLPTTGHDYGHDVIALRDQLRSLHPEIGATPTPLPPAWSPPTWT